MAATTFEKTRGSGVWFVRCTVPRDGCVSTASRDRRAGTKVGPLTLATALAEEANGLLAAGNLQGVRVRARDILRQAAVNLRGRHPGASPDAAALTVGEYFPTWLDSIAGASTRTKYEVVYRKWIAPAFKDVALNRISKRVVREWLLSMERSPELMPETARNYFRIFIALLAQAVRDEELDQHPVPSIRSIRSGRTKSPPRERRCLNREELRTVLRSLRSVVPDLGRRLPIELMAATGIRIGEAIAVRWKCVDWAENRITIRRTIYAGVEGPTKGRNRRTVGISEAFLADLRRLRTQQKEVALARGQRPTVYMFQQNNGKPIRDYTVRTGVWRAALEAVGLIDKKQTLRAAGLGPHVLRHTWITQRLQEGVPPADVSEAAGHSSTAITLGSYAHAVPSENRERLRVDLEALLT